MNSRLWTFAGAFFFCLGWIGIVLPLMPGFVFLLVALFCFLRGHPEWAERMQNHKVYGPPLRDWRERRAISRKAKKSAVIAMAIAGAITTATVGFPIALIPLTCLVAVAAWLWTRAEA